MTILDLAAIKARNEARTPGRWHTQPERYGHIDIKQGDRELACVWWAPGRQVDDIAAFIAHASEDIPALIARVEELEKDVVEADADYDQLRALLREAVSMLELRYQEDPTTREREEARIAAIRTAGGIDE